MALLHNSRDDYRIGLRGMGNFGCRAFGAAIGRPHRLGKPGESAMLFGKPALGEKV